MLTYLCMSIRVHRPDTFKRSVVTGGSVFAGVLSLVSPIALRVTPADISATTLLGLLG